LLYSFGVGVGLGRVCVCAFASRALCGPGRRRTDRQCRQIALLDPEHQPHENSNRLNPPSPLPTNNTPFLPPQLPPLYRWLQEQGGISDAEMRRTFNCGVGLIAVVNKADVAAAKAADPGLFELGVVVEGSGVTYVA
jgi:hypothetical protein